MIRRRTSPSVHLVLPATSANLGPAFDAAALAFSLFLKVRARPASEFSVTATGRDAAICGRLEDHLILSTYRDVLDSEKRSVVPLALHIDNQIPIGKGCGSSAAARLAGIALAVRFGRLKWDANRIISEASQREHHPDNAAACWLGGLAVASSGEDETRIAQFKPKGKWPLLLVVPDEALSTEEARRVLPTHYSRADVVANLQNSMLLFAALTQGRSELIRGAVEDRIHQPYRAPLCQLLAPLQSMAETPGVLGACLSGAGPSVLMFLDPEISSVRGKRQVANFLKENQLAAELVPTVITNRGARVSFQAKR